LRQRWSRACCHHPLLCPPFNRPCVCPRVGTECVSWSDLRYAGDSKVFCFVSQLLFHRRTMPRLSLSNLGAMVKKRRGASKLREAAADIGMSAPTLLRGGRGRLAG